LLTALKTTNIDNAKFDKYQVLETYTDGNLARKKIIKLYNELIYKFIEPNTERK